MRRPLTPPFLPGLAASTLVAAALFVACDDTPRGVQGIDFNTDGGTGDDDGTADAATDAHGRCQEVSDPTGVCTQINGAGSIYTHRIDCVGGDQPAFLECDTADGGADGGLGAPPGDGGVQTFCCTTGLL